MTAENYRASVLRRLTRHLKERRSALAKMQRRACEFCGLEDVEVDAEHVFPLWLSVPILARMNAPRAQSAKGNDVISRTKPIDALHVKVRAACKRVCNNGWMNKLETNSSTFMKPMML